MATTFTLIKTYTLASAAASFDFTSIPSTYTDLCLKISARSSSGFVGNVVDSAIIYFNTDTSATTNYSARCLLGSGSAATSDTTKRGGFVNGTSSTTSSFSNTEFYIPNYAGNNYKSVSIDGVQENNATAAYAGMEAWLWSNTAAINAITLKLESAGNFVTYSTASLYGILKA